jgi:hypothetical protein
MKNLNRTIEKAAMPNPVISVNRKFLYSLCAALFLLTCSLSTKAQVSNGYGSGTKTDPWVMNTLSFSDTTAIYDSACTACSPLINDDGDANHSGPDKWIKIRLADNAYLSIGGGTSEFDSVFRLYDENLNLITSADDGYGSTGMVVWQLMLQPQIQYYADAGTYYLVVDGTDKYGEATSGTVSLAFWITH